jgi:AcrR family transcriptional regulator
MAIEGGAQSITMSAVAKAAGISRSSIYEYFSSSADLISDLVIDELRNYRNQLAASTSVSKDPLEQVGMWIEEALRYVVDGRHILIKSLNAIAPPDFRCNEIKQGHRDLMQTISGPLSALGIPTNSSAISLLQSAIDTAAKRIDAGNNPEVEVAFAKTYALAGISALAESFRKAASHQI